MLAYAMQEKLEDYDLGTNEQGVKKEKQNTITMIKSLYANNVDIKVIAKSTKLTIKEIKNILGVS